MALATLSVSKGGGREICFGASARGGLSYTDSTVQSGTYYYVVKSVDSDGYESPGTLEMTVTVGARSVGGSGGGGGGGCFISAIAN